MTPIQQKAIQQAIKLLEEIETHAFFAENYKDEAALKAAAKKQNTDAFQDGRKKREAIEWLKAALG